MLLSLNHADSSYISLPTNIEKQGLEMQGLEQTCYWMPTAAYKLIRHIRLWAISSPGALRQEDGRTGWSLTELPPDPTSQPQLGLSRDFPPLSSGSFPRLPALGSASPPLMPARLALIQAVRCHLHSFAPRSPNSVCQGHSQGRLMGGNLLFHFPAWSTALGWGLYSPRAVSTPRLRAPFLCPGPGCTHL